MQRMLFVLAAALMLGGCNMVYAEQPLFTAADATGAPTLRPGSRMTAASPRTSSSPAARGSTWRRCATG